MLSFDPNDAGYLRELAEFVAVPSISRDASDATMRAAADWLAGRLAFAGGRVVETAGHPAVRGEWLGAPGAPTVLVYGHYDVQPTGERAEWESPPFELTVDGDVARARGVSDDKGPVYIVLKTAQAFMAQEGRLPLNVKFLFEGEEEIGSPHLPAFVAANARELAADLVISADGAMWRPSEPSLALKSKGLVAMDIVVTGARGDLHSGRYGGTVANPLHALSEILASLHTPDGSVAVAGFYDGIPVLTPARRRELAGISFDVTHYLSELGLAEAHGEPGYTTLERLWERPTLEINGARGPPGVCASRWPWTRPGSPPTRSRPATRPSARPPPRSSTSTPMSRCCWPASPGRCRPPTCSSAFSGSRRCSSRSPPRTRSCTRPTSSCASAGSERECGHGNSCGACSPTAHTAFPTLEETVANADYTAYSYLTAGEDYRSFELAPEFGRVPPYSAGLTEEEQERAHRLLRDSLVISLHDHPVRFPARMEESPEYNRTGRQHAAYAGLAASGLTVVFDNIDRK